MIRFAILVMALAQSASAATVVDVARQAGFSGAILSSKGAAIVARSELGDAAITNGPKALWRWASVTKQVIATLTMQEVAKGRIGLDAPVVKYLPDFASKNAQAMTVRNLLRHQSGLPNSEAQLGFIALGQWVFTAPIKGCTKPVRIVERRGAIGGIEVRNLILPDQDVVVIAFSDRADFAFGEIWQGRGFSYDALAAAACS